MFEFCTADFWSSLAYESADLKPKHFLTPRFPIPLDLFEEHIRLIYRMQLFFPLSAYSFSCRLLNAKSSSLLNPLKVIYKIYPFLLLLS